MRWNSQGNLDDLTGFKDVPGYEGIYQVNSNGVVVKIMVEQRDGVPVKRFRYVAIRKATVAYPSIHLYKNGVNTQIALHRVIMLAFVPNPNNLSHINHINGIKSDCRVENLEWCTMSYNLKHAYDTGLHKPTTHQAKITYKDADDIREQYKNGITSKELALKYGLTPACILRTVKFKHWKRKEDILKVA